MEISEQIEPRAEYHYSAVLYAIVYEFFRSLVGDSLIEIVQNSRLRYSNVAARESILPSIISVDRAPPHVGRTRTREKESGENFLRARRTGGELEICE